LKILPKPYKILPLSKQQTSHKATKTALAVFLMLITFLQEVVRYQVLMPADWLQNYFNTI